MAQETKVDTLIINDLSKAQYESIIPSDTELYFINDTLDAQYDVLPTAQAKYDGQITQYVGTNTSLYTNGYFYKCTSKGTSPETYQWVQTNVQPGGSGSSDYEQLVNKPQVNGITLQGNKTDSDLHLLGSYTEMPTASAELEDKIVHFAGEGGSTPSSATVRSDRTDWYKYLTVDKTKFENAYKPTGDVTAEFLAHNDEGTVTWTLDGVEVNIAEYGIEYDDGSAPASGIKVFVDYVAGKASYTNGYFYKCIAQGTRPETYAWEQIDTQPAVWEKGTGEGSIVSISNALQGGQALGNYSVAEGYGSDAKGNYSHTEGQLTTTNGSCAHAEGSGTTAQADCSHAEGLDTIAQNQSEHAEGQFNKSNKASTIFGDPRNTIHSIGIGTGVGSLEDQDRRNAVEVMQNGSVYINGIGEYDGKNFSEADTLQDVVNGKQDSLTIGTGLTLDDTTNTLSANINNTVTSTSTTDSLSANMGKVLQDQVTNLKNIGRFLSIWDSTTGQPTTQPIELPYTYRTGDYYRVGTVAAEGGTNYKPNGATYTGQPSTTVETEDVEIGSVYYYDGTAWMMQKSGSGGKVQDVQINGTTILDLDSGVANIPIASNSTLGVAKYTPANGIDINTSTGMPYIARAGAINIQAKQDQYRPIVPADLDKAVMEGLGNNSLTWSAAYKTSAQTTIGINTEQFVFTMADGTEVTHNIKVSA